MLMVIIQAKHLDKGLPRIPLSVVQVLLPSLDLLFEAVVAFIFKTSPYA